MPADSVTTILSQLTEQSNRMGRLEEKLGAIEADIKQLAGVERLTDKNVTAADKKLAVIEEQIRMLIEWREAHKRKHEEANKQASMRNWALWSLIISSLVGTVITLVLKALE